MLLVYGDFYVVRREEFFIGEKFNDVIYSVICEVIKSYRC